MAEVLCEGWREIRCGRRPVLGVPEGPYLEQTSPEGMAAFREQAKKLEADGYVVQHVAALRKIARINERHTHLIAGEAARQQDRGRRREGAGYIGRGGGGRRAPGGRR